jgi:hypothetical protein
MSTATIDVNNTLVKMHVSMYPVLYIIIGVAIAVVSMLIGKGILPKTLREIIVVVLGWWKVVY